jgi:hypothetical protein
LQLGARRGVRVRVDRPGRTAERIPAAAVERALSSDRVRQRS